MCFCELLTRKLGDKVSFRVPEGGLAVWVHFDRQYPLAVLREAAGRNGLLISRSVFQEGNGNKINAIRMGFASLDEQELTEAVDLLAKSLRAI